MGALNAEMQVDGGQVAAAVPATVAHEGGCRADSIAFRVSALCCSFEDDDDPGGDLAFSGMSGGKIVHEALVECGIDTVFGYSGGANLPVCRAPHPDDRRSEQVATADHRC